MDAVISKMAQVVTVNIPSKWTFVPHGSLIVNDRDAESFYGKVLYDNENYEIGESIKIKDWVFVLERLKTWARKQIDVNSIVNPKLWFISGFFGSTHCTFTSIEEPDVLKRNDLLVRFIIEKMWTVLHPEEIEKMTNVGNVKVKQISWVKKSFASTPAVTVQPFDHWKRVVNGRELASLYDQYIGKTNASNGGVSVLKCDEKLDYDEDEK